MIDVEPGRPSTAGLLSDALSKTSQLIGSELQLVQIEIGEKITIAITAVVAIVVAAIFLIVAMIFLLGGVVAVLAGAGFSPANANFIVGGGIAFIALVALFVALRRLSAAKLRPGRSLRQAHDTAHLVKGAAR